MSVEPYLGNVLTQMLIGTFQKLQLVCEVPGVAGLRDPIKPPSITRFAQK